MGKPKTEVAGVNAFPNRGLSCGWCLQMLDCPSLTNQDHLSPLWVGRGARSVSFHAAPLYGMKRQFHNRKTRVNKPASKQSKANLPFRMSWTIDVARLVEDQCVCAEMKVQVCF